ncbi:uncharacterized protein LOC131018681 [Salvia miltiorrhiza]|uniref:uncharacterized protein LOC131018681 n=1 Tax=Salvia miltiorrhiza TaxID=226208 RepID=UPI0025AB91C1|nr:uncharacterized protein LOC131018681 [Salvia miltiorrhiza]
MEVLRMLGTLPVKPDLSQNDGRAAQHWRIQSSWVSAMQRHLQELDKVIEEKEKEKSKVVSQKRGRYEDSTHPRAESHRDRHVHLREKNKQNSRAGENDPKVHMAKFETVITLHQYTKGIKCKIFSTTLTGIAQQWFRALEPDSIHSFEQLHDAFMCQYASSERAAKTAMSLMDLKQEPTETLKEFAAHFTNASLEVPKAKSQIKGYAFVRGLRPAAFFDNLQLKEARAARKIEYSGNKPKKVENKAKTSDTRPQGRALYRGLPPRVLPGKMQPAYQPTRNEQMFRGVHNVNRLTDQSPAE